MSASPSRRIRSFLTHIFPWALFLACLLWGWRVKDLFYDIPAYGDVLLISRKAANSSRPGQSRL